MKNILVSVIFITLIGLLISGIYLGSGNLQEIVINKGTSANETIQSINP